MQTNQALQVPLPDIAPISKIADAHATAHLFADYRSRTASNTLTRQDDDLAAFSDFLLTVQVKRTAVLLGAQPRAWQGISWGMVKAFVGYLLHLGYAVGSVNGRLSTIKTYAALACQAGAVPPDELTKIKAVRGYSRREAMRLDAERNQTRVSTKKSEPVVLDAQTSEALRDQPPTLQGLRDALVIAFMLDMGLRVGEVCGLRIEQLDMAQGKITFYREKVDRVQTHTLPQAMQALLKQYLVHLGKDGYKRGPLIRGARKNGVLSDEGMKRFALFTRIRRLGAVIGIDNLSPHDLRHTWATGAARAGVSLERLRDAGGWSSISTPANRYIRPATIANQGVLDVLEPKNKKDMQ